MIRVCVCVSVCVFYVHNDMCVYSKCLWHTHSLLRAADISKLPPEKYTYMYIVYVYVLWMDREESKINY